MQIADLSTAAEAQQQCVCVCVCVCVCAQALAEEIGHLEKRCEVEERDAGGDINAIEDEIEKQEGAVSARLLSRSPVHANNCACVTRGI